MSIAWENTPQTQAFSADPVINNKIAAAAAGLQPSVQRYFLEFPTEKDKELVADFILSSVKQENVAIKTKRVYLIALTYLSRSLDNKYSFDVMTSDDLSNYI